MLWTWWLASAVVVLDPGHGGSEAGAERHGLKEKDICLQVARVAARTLRARGHQVFLTRTADRDVSLDRRIQLAHARDADAFVSIHVNASPARSRRGTETYVASVLTDPEAESLVAREEEGAPSARAPSETGAQAIVADLRRQAAHRASARLAAAVQSAVSRVRGMGPSRGLRQAPFWVLRAARVPAVLLEAGYLSHRRQAMWLGTAKGAAAVGKAVADGLERFLSR